ncbi:MAG: CHAT domain-containing protein [Acidobacteriota bacterium]
MTDDTRACEVIRALIRRGAYREAAAFAEDLPLEIKGSPAVARERSRGFLKQGHPINAEDALAAANLLRATPGERLIVALEAAALQVYRHLKIKEAIAIANQALAATYPSVDPSDQAEAERVHARILLIAATYYEITPEEGQQARDRLLRISETLEQAGRIDEALAARLTYAERLDDPLTRTDALLKLADDALEAARPNLAAEAKLIASGQMMLAGEPSSRIVETLDLAAALYQQGNHAHGQIDVQLAKAKLAVEREFADPKTLEACLRAYAELEFPRGEISVLMDLSQLAHERGDTGAAAEYRRQTLALSEQVGMGLARDSFQTAQIDLMMRHADYGGAIELCQAAITTEPPAMLKAGYEQLLGAAYSFINDLDASCVHTRKAIEMWVGLGAIDSASDAVVKLASDLSSLRREEAWQEAEDLLPKWSAKDEERRDLAAAVSKQEMVGQVKIARYLYSHLYRGEARLLAEAEEAIAKAEVLAHGLAEREAIQRLGNLQQLRGQVYQAREDEDGVLQAWRNALALYKQAGLEMYVANCHFMLGVIFLNRSNQDLATNFSESENNLRKALEYYETARMRGQAADSRFMLARLYVNASTRVLADLSVQMIDAALGHLLDAESDYDAIRQEFNAGASILEVQRGKRALIEKSQRIYELALDIVCRFRPDPTEAWKLVQRAKARALSDILGTGSAPPSRVMAELERHPDSYELVAQERELASRIGRVPAEQRLELRAELDTVRQRMSRDPLLSEYQELRIGAALDSADLESMLSDDALAGQACVCIDWFAIGDLLFLVAARPGCQPEVVPLPLTLSKVRALVRNDLGPESFRVTLQDVPELLRELDPLISPIAGLSDWEDLLILSPTGPLHALPLHALEIDSDPLLVRNPIVYCSSLSVMRQCLARHRIRRASPVTALFGDPNGDRPEAAKLMTHLEQLLTTEAFIGKDVTRAALISAISGRDFIHFQGHAVHQPSEPLDSFLALADGNLTAREIFDLPNLQAELVTLAACESAASVIATGDEPLGLIPAFLYAGTNSMVATLWKVNQTSAALTMRLFYDMLANGNTPVDKALALQQAMLAVRSTPGFDSPYHWAPFILHGNWR